MCKKAANALFLGRFGPEFVMVGAKEELAALLLRLQRNGVWVTSFMAVCCLVDSGCAAVVEHCDGSKCDKEDVPPGAIFVDS